MARSDLPDKKLAALAARLGMPEAALAKELELSYAAIAVVANGSR